MSINKVHNNVNCSLLGEPIKFLGKLHWPHVTVYTCSEVLCVNLIAHTSRLTRVPSFVGKIIWPEVTVYMCSEVLW